MDIFGFEWNYDDMFFEFIVERYDLKEWLDLISDVGVKYFVIMIKYYDGFVLFDIGDFSNCLVIYYGFK